MALEKFIAIDASGRRKVVEFDPAVVGGGGGFACTCVVDFGSGDTDASVVVTGQTWVTASSVIVCTVQGEDARIQDVIANADTRVAGVGFTVRAHAPLGATGTFTVNCVGV